MIVDVVVRVKVGNKDWLPPGAEQQLFEDSAAALVQAILMATQDAHIDGMRVAFTEVDVLEDVVDGCPARYVSGLSGFDPLMN